MRKRHIFTQTTHAAHFIAADGMDDGSCAKEEQGFEHGMCEKVEHRSHIAESDDWSKGMIFCIIVEFYAILSLLASFLMLNGLSF